MAVRDRPALIAAFAMGADLRLTDPGLSGTRADLYFTYPRQIRLLSAPSHRSCRRRTAYANLRLGEQLAGVGGEAQAADAVVGFACNHVGCDEPVDGVFERVRWLEAVQGTLEAATRHRAVWATHEGFQDAAPVRVAERITKTPR